MARLSVREKSTKKKAPGAARPPAKKAVPAPGRRYWLLKTEPTVFSFADLEKAPRRTTGWDGVRNYQARNCLRDQMQVGDGVLIYHSNADPMAIVGVAEVVRAGYPDQTQFDRKNIHYDPGAETDDPTWFMVDVKAIRPLKRALPLTELRGAPGLEKMVLLQKGSRLSVQPVRAEEWAIVTRLGG